MASRHAHLSCVLKVDQQCNACKMHAMEVLGCIDGVYNATFDAETKTVRIMGEVDPNYCIKALARCGIHAEVVRANLTHPRFMTSTRGVLYDYNNDYYGTHNPNYFYGPDPYSKSHRRSLPEGMWHEGYLYHHQYPVRNALPEYSYNSDYYYNGATRYYPRAMEYYPYSDDEHMNSCRIM